MRAPGLPVPPRDAGETMRDVGDLDVERRGIEQIEPASGQHALPGARGGAARSRLASHGKVVPFSLQMTSLTSFLRPFEPLSSERHLSDLLRWIEHSGK